MLLQRKNYNFLKKQKKSVLKIQNFLRKCVQKRKIMENLKKLIKLKKKENEKLIQKKKMETFSQNKEEKNEKNLEKPTLIGKEKLFKPKDPIKIFPEQNIKKSNKIGVIKLSKIKSIKELEEKTSNLKLSKKGSHPLLTNDSYFEQEEQEEWFTTKLENTKKINNLLANADILINNLTKIYSNDKKNEKPPKRSSNKKISGFEEKFSNDLLNFYNKNQQK